MWYERNKLILAGVYDTLAGIPLKWTGNFKNTFSEFSTYGNRPDPDAIPDFFKQYVVPMLLKYEQSKNIEDYSVKYEITQDIDSLKNFASSFIDYYLKQEKIPRATYVLIETLGLTSRVKTALGGDPIYLTDKSWRIGDSGFAQNILNLDYGYLKAVAQAGLNFSPAFLYYVISGNDVKENPMRAGDSRNAFIQYFTNALPYTQYYLPQMHGRLQDSLQNPNFDAEITEKMKVSGFDVENSYVKKREIQRLFVETPSRSGASKEEAFPFLLSYLKNPNSDKVLMEYSLISPYRNADIIPFLQQINDGQIAVNPDNLKNFIESFRAKFDELEEADVKQLRNMPEIMQIINSEKDDYYDQYRIEAGLGDAEETIEYLKKSPERIKKIKYKDFLPPDVVTEFVAENQQREALVASDVTEAFKEALRLGKLKRTVANQDQFVMDFLLNEGTKNAGLNEDEIRGYANYLTVYRFSSYDMKSLLGKTGTTEINGVDFAGNWSGLFMPRFADPEDNTQKPAIFIKTDAHNTHEYLQGLAENLKLSLSAFSEATTKHEGSHALHYLGAGDAIMESPVLTQERERKERQQELDNMSPEERALTPGKNWESDEMLYLTDPAEIYARAHGDIPHLLEVFKQKIEELKDNPLVAQAIENQWVDDVVGTMAGVASGGTNAVRLQKDLARGDGWLGKSDDPIQAMNKILERQEAKLRSAYRDNVLEDQRNATLNVMREIKQKQNEILQANQKGESDYYLKQQLAALNKEFSLVRTRRVFNVDGIADLILAGYLRDYMMRLTDAVGAGQITTDRIVSPETLDEIKARENAVKKRPTEDRVLPPTAMDIRDLGEDLVKQSRPIPGGRNFDFLARLPAPMDAREGFYPHLQTPGQEESQVTASMRWYFKR